VRVRLTAAVALLVFVVGGVVALWFVRRVERSLVDEAQARNAEVLDEITSALASGKDPRDVLVPIPDGGVAGNAFVPTPGFGAPGTVIYVDGQGGADLLDGRFNVRIPSGTDPGSVGAVRTGPDEAVASLAVSGASGPGQLLATSPLDDVRNSVDTLRHALWFAVPALALAMGALAWLVTGRALRPVEAIARRADEITSASLHERVPEPATGDEVAHLARTVNAMLGRLEEGAARQRRFVSDASHELRSPLTAIRSQVEVGLLTPDTDWDAVGRTVLDESARLEQLVDDLLALARASEGSMSGRSTSERADLRDVVTTEAGRHRRVPVTIEADAPAWATIGARDAERVLRHLLDNAARHARGGVKVAVRTNGDGITVLVDDDGAGIAPADRARALERFTRLDEGRSRDAGGAGLGLAVADEIVRSSGGQLSIEESTLGGARLRVRLPAAPPG
jgi:signal transduction histidine kinase